jgi:uncharacterized protein YndB with AHSA1/START domain
MTTWESTAADSEATESSVSASVEIAVPPEEVFEALTDPTQLEEWWGTPNGYSTSDWRIEPQPGGEWSVRTEAADGSQGEVRGVYRVVDPPSMLEFTWAASWDDFAETTVRFELEPATVRGVSGTRLTVTHTGLATLSARARLEVSGSAQGGGALAWPQLLRSFALAMREYVAIA